MPKFLEALKKFSKKLFSEPVARRAQGYGLHSTDPDRDLTGYMISADSFFAVYKNQADVYACVREYQQNVLAGGYKFVDAIDPEANPDEEFVKKANSVLNYFVPFRELKKRMIRDYMIAGNNYNHLVKNKSGNDVLGIQPFDPRTVALVTDEFGTIHKYIQRLNQGQTETVIFEPEEVGHWKNGVDPNHESFGMSPLESIMWEVRTDLAAMIQNFFFFKNNATPDVMYILDDNMTEEEIKSAVDNIKNQFQGPENSHKSAVLSHVKEIKTINITQKDMEFLAGRRFTTEKICSCYGVPKVVLNYTDGVNYSTAEIQYIKFIENSVGPVEEEIVDFLNREVLKRIQINGVPLTDRIRMIPIPQATEAQAGVEDRALRELSSGAITLRQYKNKTGQEVTEMENKDPMFDKHIIHAGAAAVLLEDVGIDPFVDPNDDVSAQKFMDQLNKFKKTLDEKDRR